MVLSGDLLWHDTVWHSAAADHARTGRGTAFDFDPMFAALRPMIEAADLAVCHEEVPFAAPGAPYQSYPVFAAPPEIATWIGSMGWDLCTTASNHAVDQGYDGLVRTANLLERAGVGHVGTFRTAAERRRPVIHTTEQGVRIAVVGGTYSLNGFPAPAGREWSVSMWDVRNLLAQARAARRAGADIVIVKYHGGSEYVAMPNAQQVALVRALTASPYVDLVAGEHAHVVQPITKVNGKWVVYGMGNAVGQSETSRPRAYEGITVGFTFRETARLAASWSTMRSTCRRTGTTTRPDVPSASSGWCGRWRAESGTRRGCARRCSPRERPWTCWGTREDWRRDEAVGGPAAGGRHPHRRRARAGLRLRRRGRPAGRRHLGESPRPLSSCGTARRRRSCCG